METIATMNKTQLNMYSTMTPTGPSLKRGQLSGVSRSSRYRYINANKSFNPEVANISSSISKDYRPQARIALPCIKKQKGFMLEEWLNDALQGDEGAGLKQPLRTLKKYEMDKGSLRNANLSLDQIGNLYNGLFVYTSGIKNTFQEMFKSASLQNRDDHKIEKTYWKIFIKLLENTIPVKTCFQIIQDQYRREISNLRKTIIEEHEKTKLMQEDYEQKLRKLRKQIQEFDKKEKQFQKQFNVMNSNLILYQESFNEEVSLRLKFQQKINQVYTSYDELKQKFECIRQELGYKTKHLMAVQQENNKLQNQVADELIKNGDIIQKLQMVESRLAERQSEITIKNQQITDIKQENHDEDQKKKLNEIALDELIVTIKVLRKSQAEHDKKVKELRETISTNQDIIKKLKESLSNSREKNDDVYLKFHEASVKNQENEDERIRLSICYQELKTKLLLTENKLGLAHAEKQQLSSKMTKLQVELTIKIKELSDKNNVIEVFDTNISELKAIKDRYERLNELLKGQLQTCKVQLANNIKEVGEEKSKSFEHKYQVQKLVKLNTQHEITIQQLKKTIQRKQLEIISINDSCKSRLNEANLKTKQIQSSMNQQKKELAKINESLSKKDNQKLSKLDEISYIKKRNGLIEKELQEKKDKISQLLEEKQKYLIEIDKLKKKLQSKDFTLNHKREEIDGQIINLRLSIIKYKKIVDDRLQYVHPMIYEDQRSRVMELLQQIEMLKAKSEVETQQ